MSEDKGAVVIWLLLLLGFVAAVHFSDYEAITANSDGFIIGCIVSVITWFVAELIDLLL